MNATDGERAWQFLARGSSVTLENGAVLDLGQMELQSGTGNDGETAVATVALVDLEVSADAAIRIASSGSSSGWTVPTFIIHSVDGTDGKNGLDGETGADGEAGEDGEDGADGEEGTAGTAGEEGTGGGSGGAGERGNNGKDGENTDEDEEEMGASVYLNILDWEQTAGSAEFYLRAYNTELVLTGTTDAYILNVSTGAKVATFDFDLSEWTDGEIMGLFSCDDLSPNTEYKLVISAKVKKSEDDNGSVTYAKTILVSRTFSTDENGFCLKKVLSDYINSDNLSDYYSEDPNAAKGAALGFTAMLSGGQSIKEITSVTITDESGNVTELDDDEREALAETVEDGSVYMLYGLDSNTSYTITVEATLSNGKTSTYTDTYLTLKATPTATKAYFDVNSNRFFVSGVGYEYDPDGAIEYYSHEIYRWYSGEGESGDCLKRKTTTDLEIYIYLSDAIQDGVDSRGVANYYSNVVTVTWYDNEKYVTKEVSRISSWSAQHIADSDSAYVYFEETGDGIQQNEVTGELHVYTGTGSTIYVGDSDVHRILVTISSSGNYTKTLYYGDLSDWTTDSGTLLSGETSFTGDAYVPLKLSGLTAGTSYTVTVTAYFSSSTSVAKTVGSTLIRTPGTNEQTGN